MTEGAIPDAYIICNEIVAVTCYLQLKLYFVEKMHKIEESKSIKSTTTITDKIVGKNSSFHVK